MCSACLSKVRPSLIVQAPALKGGGGNGGPVSDSKLGAMGISWLLFLLPAS